MSASPTSPTAVPLAHHRRDDGRFVCHKPDGRAVVGPDGVRTAAGDAYRFAANADVRLVDRDPRHLRFEYDGGRVLIDVEPEAIVVRQPGVLNRRLEW